MPEHEDTFDAGYAVGLEDMKRAIVEVLTAERAAILAEIAPLTAERAADRMIAAAKGEGR